MIEIAGKEVRNVNVLVEQKDIFKCLYDMFNFNHNWKINEKDEACIEVDEYYGSHSRLETYIDRKLSKNDINIFNAIKTIENAYNN